jgi:hypothetical protein
MVTVVIGWRKRVEKMKYGHSQMQAEYNLWSVIQAVQ